MEEPPEAPPEPVPLPPAELDAPLLPCAPSLLPGEVLEPPIALEPPVVLEPLELLGALLEPPAALEPLALPCSRRQRSFSEPVRLSHCMVPPPSEGDVVDEEGDVVDELSLADEPVLPEPPTLCDDDCAMAAAENANSAANVAVESALSIDASPI